MCTSSFTFRMEQLLGFALQRGCAWRMRGSRHHRQHDKEPIIFNGNDGIFNGKGTLYECGRFYKRNGLFQPLFSHRAVALSNGKRRC